MFHEEDVDTGLSFLKLNEIGPATTEMVDNEIKRLLQVHTCTYSVCVWAHCDMFLCICGRILSFCVVWQMVTLL